MPYVIKVLEERDGWTYCVDQNGTGYRVDATGSVQREVPIRRAGRSSWSTVDATRMGALVRAIRAAREKGRAAG